MTYKWSYDYIRKNIYRTNDSLTPMKLKIIKTNFVFLFLLLPLFFTGQTITHPSSGSSSTTVTCGTTYTYYDPGGVGNYGNNQLGTLTLNPSTAGQFVQINFGAGAFDIEPNGGGCYDWIRVYDGPTTGSPLIGTYCNSNVPGTITSSSGSLTVVFDSDGGVTGSGWAASVSCSSTPGPIIHPSSGSTSMTVQCGATYTYYDPGVTGNYGNNQLGTYTFNPSVGGQFVQINFGAGAFDIEPNGGGCYDWIRVYDGPTTGSPLIGTYCNSNVPGTITSTTGSLTVVFDSDGGVTGTGWVASVSCFIPCATVPGTSSSSIANSCGSTSTTLSLAGEGAGTIQWQQSTDGGTTWTNIAGATTDPYVHTTSISRMYRAAVTNGCTSYSTTSSITIDCNLIHPSSGTSSTTIQCGAGTYTYYDPGIGGNYGNNQLGTYTINPSTGGDMVQINFGAGAFDIEPNGGGCYDWIMIYDGPNTGSPLIGTYCNSNVPGTITSTTGPLTIVFDSDGNTTGSGWAASVNCFTPCGVVAGTASSSIGTSCGSTNTTLSLAGEGAGSIQWQQSTDGGTTWTNIAGATTDPYVHTTSVTRMYRAAVTNGCTSYSTTATLTIDCSIIHPASGTSSTTINCATSYTYRDPGDGGNYGNNENGLITICPSTAGQYVSINFTSFNLESSYDFIYVFDGDYAGAPILGIYTGTSLSGVVKATATNGSGCLSFRFYSDGATTSSGWQATVTCSAIPSLVVPSSNIEDCQGAYTICNDGTFSGGTTGYGFDELPAEWNSCLGNAGARGEYESTWAVFSPATSGTVGFEITPTTAADYDWAIWGPYTSLECPAFNNDVPIRCSSTSLAGTGGGGVTGLIAPANDVIEQNGEYGGGANENGKLRPLDVLAGEIYVVMLDNWDANTTPFTLDWTLTNGATLDCTPVLPVNLVNFTATCDGDKTLVKWVTETETNNDYYAIEKSGPDFNFYEIGRIKGAGNSNNMLEYSFKDDSFNAATTYYRLKQVDFNGESNTYRVVASNCHNNDFDVSNIHLTDAKLSMIISGSSDEELMVYLYDNTGKMVAQQPTRINMGNNYFTINDLNVGFGIYFVNVVGTVNKYSGKVIKE